MKIMGAYTGIGYYIINAPAPADLLKYPAVKINGTVGYYQVSWDLFPQYQNLNLATATADGTNTTFKGSAPSFSFGAGVDYPLGFYGLSVSGEASYLYLNFKNVAWYNSVNQEVV